jgi:hypothetical protein
MLKALCSDFGTLKQITQSYVDFLLNYGWGCLNVTLFMSWLPIFLLPLEFGCLQNLP